MKQDKPKTQDETIDNQDKLLFDSQAVEEAEQVVPIPKKTAETSATIGHPRVSIRGFRRSLSPLVIVLIAIFSVGTLALIGAAVYQNSTKFADTNDEAIITDTKDETLEVQFKGASAALETTAEPVAKPVNVVNPIAKKSRPAYIPPKNTDNIIIRNNDFERKRIIDEKQIRREIRKDLKRFERERKKGKKHKNKNRKKERDDDDDDID